MEKIGLFKWLDLPEGFGVALLTLSLIAVLAPYCAGADFGIFKIPNINDGWKKRLTYLGPIALFICLLLYFPFFSNSDDITLENPFGASQVLLDGHKLFLTTKIETTNIEPEKIYSNPRYQIQAKKPLDGLNLKTEFVSSVEYAKALNSDTTGWTSLVNLVKANPALSNGKVFRIYEDKPLYIRLTRQSYEGTKVDSKKYLQAKEFMGNPFKRFARGTVENDDDDSNESEDDSTEDLPDSIGEKLNRMDIQAMQDSLKGMVVNDMEDVKVALFNELSVVIVDKSDIELQAIAMNGGTEFSPTPLHYLLSFGGVLPYFNVSHLKGISVSKNSRVWAFYAERKLNNVYVNGAFQREIYTDFYRIYAMNSSFIYQITLCFTPNTGSQRRVWEELVAQLESMRIGE